MRLRNIYTNTLKTLRRVCRAVDGRKSRRRKKFQHHVFIFYEIVLFCAAERCIMYIVAVYAGVKEGKDNLSTWLVCKYV